MSPTENVSLESRNSKKFNLFLSRVKVENSTANIFTSRNLLNYRKRFIKLAKSRRFLLLFYSLLISLKSYAYISWNWHKTLYNERQKVNCSVFKINYQFEADCAHCILDWKSLFSNWQLSPWKLTIIWNYSQALVQTLQALHQPSQVQLLSPCQHPG